jgi:flagella basal body P-ring formation protein FlgA
MFSFFVATLLVASGSAPEERKAARPTPGTRVLSPDALQMAMRKALDPVDAEIEIIEASHFPAPDGEIEFSWKDLVPPASPGAASRWRGFVRHEGDRRFAIWAVVRITASCRRVVATTALRPGEPVRTDQVREETYQGFPLTQNLSWGLGSVVGRAVLRSVSAGGRITPEMLVEPVLVAKGSPVVAEYLSGTIQLRVPAIAERAGRMGDVIAVRNRSSQKILAARVSGQGRVTVDKNGESGRVTGNTRTRP